MLKFNIDLEKLEALNGIVGPKNEISSLNYIDTKELSDGIKEEFSSMGILDSDWSLQSEIQPAIDILTNPNGVIKFIFTGGVGNYEQSLSYDETFKNYVSLTLTPDAAIIDDEVSTEGIARVFENFVGKSDLKSLSISYNFGLAEALVVASMLDMERKSTLRAFVDEVVYSHNSYNVNVIWRIVNSTTSSIQWFVYLVNEVVGKHEPLTQNQVLDALNQLLEKGIVTKSGEQYLLSDEFSLLSNRMVIVDNVLSMQSYKIQDSKVLNSGFTCVQAGVHDMLLLDYDGNELHFETICSTRLIDYLKGILDSEAYFQNMKADV